MQADPITYEDFLPVSAAGIFRSNLGSEEQRNYSANEARAAFERDLAAPCTTRSPCTKRRRPNRWRASAPCWPDRRRRPARLNARAPHDEPIMSHSPYAAAFAEPAGSPIRELFPYLSRPGMISFAGGYPSPALLDGAGIEQAAQRSSPRAPASCSTARPRAPRAARAGAALRARGIDAKPEDILVTTGSQQAFDLLVRVFVEPGDVVYVESPSYPATLQALRLAGARIEQVPVDDQGMRIDALETLLANAPADALPKLIYTVPTYSNPCGTLLSQERRAQLVSLAARHGVVVVEDDPYGELRFSSTAVEPIHALGARLPSASPVIYLSSLSKTLAPALRVGWMVAPAEVIRRCAIAKQTTDLHLADRAADRRGVPERRPLSGHGGTRPA